MPGNGGARPGCFNKGLLPQRRAGHQGTAVTAESIVEEEGANSEVLRAGGEVWKWR